MILKNRTCCLYYSVLLLGANRQKVNGNYSHISTFKKGLAYLDVHTESISIKNLFLILEQKYIILIYDKKYTLLWGKIKMFIIFLT